MDFYPTRVLFRNHAAVFYYTDTAMGLEVKLHACINMFMECESCVFHVSFDAAELPLYIHYQCLQ